MGEEGGEYQGRGRESVGEEQRGEDRRGDGESRGPGVLTFGLSVSLSQTNTQQQKGTHCNTLIKGHCLLFLFCLS